MKKEVRREDYEKCVMTREFISVLMFRAIMLIPHWNYTFEFASLFSARQLYTQSIYLTLLDLGRSSSSPTSNMALCE
jgi:hypothetical protein